MILTDQLIGVAYPAIDPPGLAVDPFAVIRQQEGYCAGNVLRRAMALTAHTLSHRIFHRLTHVRVQLLGQHKAW